MILLKALSYWELRYNEKYEEWMVIVLAVLGEYRRRCRGRGRGRGSGSGSGSCGRGRGRGRGRGTAPVNDLDAVDEGYESG